MVLRAGSADASLFLLDRHARLRGVYGDGPDEADRFARESGMLANWVGSDPEPIGWTAANSGPCSSFHVWMR